MNLCDEQQAALAGITECVNRGVPLVSLSGPAGSGKTSIISELCAGLHDVEVCTPTNKAAQVLRNKGLRASTFYRTFYTLEEPEPGKRTNLWFTPNRLLYAGNHDSKMPPGKRTDCSVLIIDEASMVTRRMVNQMMEMCDTLVLIGDEHQLPPVGDGIGYFCSRKHDFTLTKIWRQKDNGIILDLAREVRKGGAKVNNLLEQHFNPDGSYAEWVRSGACSIAFTNKERRRLNFVARRILGFNSPLPAAGDRMVVANNFSEDLLNGTPVQVESFTWDAVSPVARIGLLYDVGDGPVRTECTMDMEAFHDDQIASAQDKFSTFRRKRDDEYPPDSLLNIQFGYCITAHKAQGSEWDRVVVFDQRGLIYHMANKGAAPAGGGGLSPDESVRRWLYTAITRARHELAVMPCWWGKTEQPLAA